MSSYHEVLSSETHVLTQYSSGSFEYTTQKTKAFVMGTSLNNCLNVTQVVCSREETSATFFQARDAETLLSALDTSALSANEGSRSVTNSFEEAYERIVCMQLSTLDTFSGMRVHNAGNSDITAPPGWQQNAVSEIPRDSLLLTPNICTIPAYEGSTNLASSSSHFHSPELNEVFNLYNSLDNSVANPEDTIPEPEAPHLVNNSDITAPPGQQQNGISEIPRDSLLLTPNISIIPGYEGSKNLASSGTHFDSPELNEVFDLYNSLENSVANLEDTIPEPEAPHLVNSEEASPSPAPCRAASHLCQRKRKLSASNGAMRQTKCSRMSALKRSLPSGDGRSHNASSESCSSINARY